MQVGKRDFGGVSFAGTLLAFEQHRACVMRKDFKEVTHARRSGGYAALSFGAACGGAGVMTLRGPIRRAMRNLVSTSGGAPGVLRAMVSSTSTAWSASSSVS